MNGPSRTWIRLSTLLALVAGCGAGGAGKTTTDGASGTVPAGQPDAAAAPSGDAAANPQADGSPDTRASDVAPPPQDASAGARDGADASPDLRTDAAPSGADASGDAPIAMAELAGHWSGDWGQMVLREVNGKIHGTYTHDQGTIVGTYENGVLAAWWSEVPSRLPDSDAGECEFRFARVGNTIALDGRWRYGVAGAWREDWDLQKVTTPPDPALEARFSDPTAFKAHP